MPVLLRNIETTIITQDTSETKGLMMTSSEFGEGDYFKVFNLSVFQQNFSKVEEYELLTTPISFGIVSNQKRRVINIEISY